jgi:hypothetical protein
VCASNRTFVHVRFGAVCPRLPSRSTRLAFALMLKNADFPEGWRRHLWYCLDDYLALIFLAHTKHNNQTTVVTARTVHYRHEKTINGHFVPVHNFILYFFFMSILILYPHLQQSPTLFFPIRYSKYKCCIKENIRWLGGWVGLIACLDSAENRNAAVHPGNQTPITWYCTPALVTVEKNAYVLLILSHDN